MWRAQTNENTLFFFPPGQESDLVLGKIFRQKIKSTPPSFSIYFLDIFPTVGKRGNGNECGLVSTESSALAGISLS